MNSELTRETEFLEKLQELLRGLKIDRIKKEVQTDYGTVDALVEARLGQKQIVILLEFKSSGEPNRLHQAVNQLKHYSKQFKRAYPMVIAPYIGEKGQRILHQADVGFMDYAGNTFFHLDDVLIDRRTPTQPRARKRIARSLFSPVSSRIHRVLLENPTKTWTLRELADAADVSLGLCQRISQRLISEDVLRREGKLRLSDPGELLDLWATNYAFSQNEIHQFHASSRSPQRLMEEIATLQPSDEGYALTLHAGASLVAPFIRFSDVHFYVRGHLEPWVESLDLRPVDFGGNVSILKPYDEGVFYGSREINGHRAVGDVQLYLDLFNFPTRGREQADFLREQRFSW